MIASLSIVFPMYNEEGNIERAVAGALRAGRKITDELEIIIVDDAGTDRSPRIADELAAVHPELRVIHHRVNQKLGGALRTGFAAATKEWILYVDSDLPINMDDALQAVPLAEEADVVIAWRTTRAESCWRSIQSRGYNLLIRLLFGLRVRDVNFAFKLFRRACYLQARLESSGSFIDAELLLELKRHGARFAEFGLRYYPRTAGVSTLGGLSAAWGTIGDLLRYRIYGRTRRTRNADRERGRLRAEPRHQPGDSGSLPAGDSHQHEPHAERAGV